MVLSVFVYKIDDSFHFFGFLNLINNSSTKLSHDIIPINAHNHFNGNIKKIHIKEHSNTKSTAMANFLNTLFFIFEHFECV